MNIVKLSRTPSVLMSELKEQEYKIRFFITKNSDILKLKEDNPFDVRLKRLKIFDSNELTLKNALKSINEKTSNPLMTYISLNTLDDNIAKNLSLNDIDTGINEFLENITSIDNTVIIITSLKGHNENYSSKNEADFYSRKNYHMPLIIKWPNSLTPNIHTSLTSMQDIVPTLGKEVLGINNEYIDYSTGTNICDTSNRTWFLTGNNRTFYIITKDQTTIFDQYGNTSVYNDLGSSQENTKLSTIIKAMKLLTIYKGK
jgi:membrane-anchored protein YejM (alkaline phosphatase superfamily)